MVSGNEMFRPVVTIECEIPYQNDHDSFEFNKFLYRWSEFRFHLIYYSNRIEAELE